MHPSHFAILPPRNVVNKAFQTSWHLLFTVHTCSGKPFALSSNLLVACKVMISKATATCLDIFTCLQSLQQLGRLHSRSILASLSHRNLLIMSLELKLFASETEKETAVSAFHIASATQIFEATHNASYGIWTWPPRCDPFHFEHT